MTLLEFLSKNQGSILKSLQRHIYLVLISVFIGFIIAVPLGIFLSRHKKIAKYVLALIGAVQTIPGLVMLGFTMIIFGIGLTTAIVVLTVYSILPILTNTYTGLTQVDAPLLEAARAIGMTEMQTLCKIEIPVALSSIIGGIRLSVIYIISWATLAGLIGAGGLGDLIWTGLSTYNTYYILAGAIPAAVMAFLANVIISFAQRLLTPKGLRIKR